MKRGSYDSEDPPKRNKFIGRAMWSSRESGRDIDDDNLHHKPVLLSQVVSAVRETKSRDEALEEQPPDEKSKARNRRMFGIIMGTLEKFQSEESKRKKTTARRVQIEEKLERLAEKERDVIKKEKKEQHKKRREARAELRRTELKTERVQVHEEWEKSHKTLINFIQTKTKPHLFYLPKEHTEESEKRLKQTKDKYRFILAEKRAKVQKELSEIDEMYKKETEMDEDIKSMETDENTNNNDTIEPMEESLDHKVKSDSPSERPNTITSKYKKKENGDDDDEMNNKRRDENHPIDSINNHPIDKNGNHDGIHVDNQTIGDDKSEQLAEKEFEPIYDGDE